MPDTTQDNPPIEIIDPFMPKPAERRPAAQKVAKPESLQDLNLQDELLNQYIQAKQLLKDAEFTDEIPLNQKAQALNSITTILAQIIKQQETLHSVAEVLKLEAALIETLKKFPDVREAFLKEYEGAINVAT